MTAATETDRYHVARFAQEFVEHQLTVLHDDGLYRHVRFARPNTGLTHFDLITWPGYLTIAGDMAPGYTFSRERDMFGFFRMARTGVNPQYWAEKVVSGVDGVQEFSEDKFGRLVAERLAEHAEDMPGLAAAWAAHVDCYDTSFEDTARQALADFEYVEPTLAPAVSYACRQYEKAGTDEARVAYGRAARKATFQFADTWEWDLCDWGYHYLRCCYAILWGIGQYDAHKAAAEVVELPATSSAP